MYAEYWLPLYKYFVACLARSTGGIFAFTYVFFVCQTLGIAGNCFRRTNEYYVVCMLCLKPPRVHGCSFCAYIHT